MRFGEGIPRMTHEVDGPRNPSSAPEPPNRPRYSVSGLMAYEACPYQYYATYVEGKPPRVSAAMRRGTSIHSLIARHLRQPSLLLPEAEPNVAKLFETFGRSRFNRPPVAVEEPFVLPFATGEVHGRIDVVLPDRDGALELVDFKSGSARAREELESRLQLPLYAMAAALRHDLPPDMLAYTYFFLGDGTEVSFRADDETFRRVTDRVEDIITAIQDGHFARRPGCDCYACRGEFGRSRA